MGGSLAKDYNQSRDKTDQQSFGQSTTFVDPNQVPFLQNLRSGTQNVVNQQTGAGGPGDVASQFASNAGPQQQQGIASLLAGPQGPQADIIAALQGFEGQRQAFDTPQIGANFQRGAIDPVIAQLGQDINQQLQRQIGGAGGINSQSAGAGNLGGGRDQVLSGIANEGALNAFGREAGNLRLADQQEGNRLGLQQATSQAGLQQANNALNAQGIDANVMAQLQGLMSAGGFAGTLAGQQQAGTQAGLNQIPQALETQLAPFAAQFAPLLAGSAVLGAPTVLSQGTDQSNLRRRASSFGTGFKTSGGKS